LNQQTSDVLINHRETLSSSVRDLGVTLDSELTFADHISLLTQSCFYQLRRLRAIRRSVSPKVFLTIVHAFICTRIDYCNSPLIGLPKTRLAPVQSVLNAAARMIARLPPYSHISDYMINELHLLPILARVRYKVILLVAKSQQGLAPKYLGELMSKPPSDRSSSPLRSADRCDLLIPWPRTSLFQNRAFAVVGPALCNDSPPALRSVMLQGISSASLRSLKTFIFTSLSRLERL